MPDPCRHPGFMAQVNVTRILETDSQVQPPPDAVPKEYMADVVVACEACGVRFKFLGLSSGLDLRGARVSADGYTAHLALYPGNAPPSPMDRSVLRGYDITGPPPEAVRDALRASLDKARRAHGELVTMAVCPKCKAQKQVTLESGGTKLCFACGHAIPREGPPA